MLTPKNPIHLKETLSYLYEPEFASRFARGYWRVLLVIAGILILVFSIYGVRQLLLLSELSNVTPNTVDAAPPFDRAELKTVLDGFSAREERSDSLKSNPPRFSNPSR